MIFGKLDKPKMLRKLLLPIIFSLLIVLAPFFWLFIFNIVTVTYSPKIYSPDRTYYAQVSESNGGATTGFVTSMHLVDATTPFSFSPFISLRKGKAKPLFSTNGSMKSMQVTWISENELTVAFDNCNEEYYRDEGWKSIKITYQGSC